MTSSPHQSRVQPRSMGSWATHSWKKWQWRLARIRSGQLALLVATHFHSSHWQWHSRNPIPRDPHRNWSSKRADIKIPGTQKPRIGCYLPRTSGHQNQRASLATGCIHRNSIRISMVNFYSCYSWDDNLAPILVLAHECLTLDILYLLQQLYINMC